jgi:catechol 2,3-dioxygenase-like lactoylglutathione lyase family enzyme
LRAAPPGQSVAPQPPDRHLAKEDEITGTPLTLAAVHLPCHDMAAMTAFYCDVLELPRGPDQIPIGDGPLDPWVTLQSGEVYVVLKARGSFDGVERPRDAASVHIAFRVAGRDVVDAQYERLNALGVEFRSPPKDWPWGERACFFLDPEGNLVEIFSS